MANRNAVLTKSKLIDPEGRMREQEFVCENHLPYNKHYWQVHKAQSVLRVSDYDGTKPNNSNPAWTCFVLEETEHYESGRVQTRTISVTLTDESRKALLDMLSREPVSA
jgi:hypothetical protein